MKSGKWLAVAAISVLLMAHSVLTTMEVMALRERVIALEASHQMLVRYTHDFGMHLLSDTRFSEMFRREMILRTMLLRQQQEEHPGPVSILSQVRQNTIPETAH